MNPLITALKEESNQTFTENGAVSNLSTLNSIVDFFSLAPNCLGDPEKALVSFKAAYDTDRRMALRALLWSRDVRSGAGARAPFRACLRWLAEYAPEDAIRVMDRIPTLGRWDDLLSVFVPFDGRIEKIYKHAADMILAALYNDDFLCAKWMPRKGSVALWLVKYFNMTPKQWRKMLVNICSKNFLVETKMCQNMWDDIDYSAVPSVAFARYKRSFFNHDNRRFASFLADVSTGKETINSSVVFPHDIVRSCESAGSQEQWNSLPNYLNGDDTGIVVADVSDSMNSGIDLSAQLTHMDVAVSLAIYMAERARGPFKNHFITFSNVAKFVYLPPTFTLQEKVKTAKTSQWDMNTNIQSVFDLILETAVKNNIEQQDMPKFVTIISDMQFDVCGVETNLNLIRTKYESANYPMPKLVFWNVSAYKDKPTTIRDPNTILISGFSPTILKSVFAASNFNVLDFCLNTILNPIYDFEGCKAKVNHEI